MEAVNIDKNSEEYRRMMAMSFATLRKNIIQDLITNKNESVIYKKFTKQEIIRVLEDPQKNYRKLGEISNFLYIASSHYKRLIDYYSLLPKFNYYVTPELIPDKLGIKEVRKEYKEMIEWIDKCNLKQESVKIMQSVFTIGGFFGLKYESADSFYIKPFNPRYAEITGIEDGCYTFKINLDYFSGKEQFLQEYGEEFVLAYLKYKGNRDLNIKGDSKAKWFEPSNGFCVKLNEDGQKFMIPPFCGLLLSVLDIEDYKLLKKAKKEIDNYKVLAMKMETDDDGVPKMDFDLAQDYYMQAAGNIPDGIGLILSPFDISEYSFQSSSSSDSDAAREAEEGFWFGSGTSPLLFGSSKATTSAALELSIKPDESISFSIMHQIERNVNRLIKKKNKKCLFAIKFLDQSQFNESTIQDMYFKGATYGVSGTKIKYAASLGITPNEAEKMSYLEDKILELTKTKWNLPLVSSNVQSKNSDGNVSDGTSGSSNGGGRPKEEEVAEKTEQNEE